MLAQIAIPRATCPDAISGRIRPLNLYAALAEVAR